MPHQIVWNEQGAYRKFSGHITGEEVIAKTAEVFSDQCFESMRCLISDYLGVTSSDLRMDQASYVARQCFEASRRHPDLKVAMVVQDETLEALGALVNFELEELAVPWEAEFFRTEAEALAWMMSEGAEHSA